MSDTIGDRVNEFDNDNSSKHHVSRLFTFII